MADGRFEDRLVPEEVEAALRSDEETGGPDHGRDGEHGNAERRPPPRAHGVASRLTTEMMANDPSSVAEQATATVKAVPRSQRPSTATSGKAVRTKRGRAPSVCDNSASATTPAV